MAVEYKSVKKSFREHIDFNFRIYRNIKTYFKKMPEFLRLLKSFEIGLNNRENRLLRKIHLKKIYLKKPKIISLSKIIIFV